MGIKALQCLVWLGLHACWHGWLAPVVYATPRTMDPAPVSDTSNQQGPEALASASRRPRHSKTAMKKTAKNTLKKHTYARRQASSTPRRLMPASLDIDVGYDTTQFELEASVARDLAATLSSIGRDIKPSTLLHLLHNLLYMHESVYGTAIAFEPDSYPCAANGTEKGSCSTGLLKGGVPSASGLDANGDSSWGEEEDPWTLPIVEIDSGDYAARYAPYACRGADWKEGMDFIFLDLGDGYNYWDPSQEWYHAARTKFINGELNFTQGHWTEPYFDEGAGNVEMVTFAVPFWTSEPIPSRPEQDDSDTDIFLYGRPANNIVLDWDGNPQYFWGIATIDLVLEDLTFDCADDEIYDYDLQVCRQCYPGTQRMQDDDGSPYCSECEAGYYGLGGGESCIVCPLGRYQASTGASECDQCPSGMTTGSLQMVRGELSLLEVQGSTGKDFCNCIKGSTSFLYNDTAELSAVSCDVCGEGLTCVGGNSLMLQSGYWAPADQPFSVFICSEEVACPGGEPGACSTMRSDESLACSACLSGYREGGDGHCHECGGLDFLMMPLAALCIWLFLIMIYALAVTERRATQLRSTLLAALTISQIVTLLQHLTVMDAMTVQWPEPLASLLRAMAVLAFDIDRLQVSCYMGLGATVNFSIRLFSVLGSFMVLALTHAVVVCLAFGGRFWAKRHFLYGSTGTLFITLLVPIMTTVISPLQCHLHPNGLSTLSSYPSVVCWGDEFDSPHTSMVALSLTACLFPLGVIAGVAYAVYLLPQKLRQGDTQFLQCTTCLFFRFRMDTHWYVLAFVFKNVLVTLIPVIPDGATQIILMSVTLMASMLLVVAVQPWRVMEGNMLDVGSCLAVLMVLICAAFFVEDVSTEAWAIFAVVLMTAFCCMLMLVVVLALKGRLQRKRKAYQFFLCHHKEGAGNFARFLKMTLMESGGPRCNVFLDSDNLSDLAVLYNIVRSDVELLVVLCSSKIFSRSWCVGEITIATLTGVGRVGLLLDGYEPIDDDFVANFGDIIADWRPLAEHGISLEAVQSALRAFQTVHKVPIASKVTGQVVQRLASLLLDRGLLLRPLTSGEDRLSGFRLSSKSTTTASERFDIPNSPCVGLVGLDSTEAFCAKAIIKKCLPPLIGNLAVYIVSDGLLPKTKAAVLVCSNGIFQSPCVLRLLWEAKDWGLGILPVTIEPSFRFPTSQLEGELAGASLGKEFIVEEMADLLREVFKGIAININPQEHQDVMLASVEVLRRRLLAQEYQHPPKTSITGEISRKSSRSVSRSREARDSFAISTGSPSSLADASGLDDAASEMGEATSL